jgi:hypothetical protein
MPAVSVKQKRLMGIAYAIKKGKMSKKYSKSATKAAKSMSEKALRHFAKTKEANLPQYKRKK